MTRCVLYVTTQNTPGWSSEAEKSTLRTLHQWCVKRVLTVCLAMMFEIVLPLHLVFLILPINRPALPSRVEQSLNNE